MAIDPNDQEAFVSLMTELMKGAQRIARVQYVVSCTTSALVMFLGPFLGLLVWNALPGPNIDYYLAFFIELGGLLVFNIWKDFP